MGEMDASTALRAVPEPAPDPGDEALLGAVRAGSLAAFEALMRRHNQRLFRAARAIVGDDDEAEDVVQEAYVNAYEHLHQFAGSARFSTWLTRIAVNEAIARTRKRRRQEEVVDVDDEADWTRGGRSETTPEHQAARGELRRALEAAIDRLPDGYREVFVLRDVEGMDGAEAAECLGLSEVALRVRLHRARARMRTLLSDATGDAYAFAGERCDRIVAAVLARVAASAHG